MASENDVIKSESISSLENAGKVENDEQNPMRGRPNSERCSRLTSTADESTKNVKTETAKDFDLDSLRMNVEESDLNFCKSSDRNFFSQCKNSSAIEETSSRKSLPSSNGKKDRVSRVRKETGKRRGKKNESESAVCDANQSGLENKDELSSAMGKPPNDISNQSDFVNKRYEDDYLNKARGNDIIYLANDGRNVYDFDDNEKEINMEGNSRWCHKLLKTKEIVADVMKREKREETTAPPYDDSDSSNSGLKLRIDESFGENLSFAESSLPDHFVLKVVDEEHGQSVFTKKTLSKSTYLGPLVGQKVREMDIPDDFNMKFIWEVR